MWHLHGLFVGVSLFGAVLLLAWLVKEGKREKIMTFVWATLAVGVLGLLLTSGWGMRGMQTYIQGMMGGYTQNVQK